MLQVRQMTSPPAHARLKVEPTRVPSISLSWYACVVYAR